jgi:hypothetical protein
MGSQDFQSKFCNYFSSFLRYLHSLLHVQKYRRHLLHLYLSTQETLVGYLVSWLANIICVYVFVGLLFCWYICQVPRLLFGMLLVSWLGGVLGNCFISCCKVSHSFFLIFQRPADTVTFGNSSSSSSCNNNNNKHHVQKLTFKIFLSFTEVKPFLPKEIYVSRNSGRGLCLVGYYNMSTCSS